MVPKNIPKIKYNVYIFLYKKRTIHYIYFRSIFDLSVYILFLIIA